MLKAVRNENPYPQLEQLSERLAAGLLSAAEEMGQQVQLNRVGSMLTVFFSDQPVTDFASATSSDTEKFARWFHEMLNHGIYLPCSQYEALFVSAAHTDELIDQTIFAARASFKAVISPSL